MTLPKLTDWQPLSRAEMLWFGLIFGVVTTIAAAAFWPVLPCSDDTLTHFYRVVQIDLNLKDGAPFLLWGPDFMRGYGYNVLAFYAPLSYWLVEIIHLLGLDFGVAMQVATVLSLWWAGWGGYVLARKFLTSVGAFVSGLAYLFAPYILYDAIQRGTLPETLALAFVPWALAASLYALDNPSRRHIAVAVLLFVLCILSHNVVPIFALGLLVVFAVVSVGIPGGSLRHIWACYRPLLLILSFSLGITLFFWLPGLMELRDTQSQQDEFPFKQWPSYEQHILPVDALVEWPDDPADLNLLNPPIVRSLGLMSSVFALLGLVSLVWYPWGVSRRRLLALALVSITAVYLSSQLSIFFWDNLRLLNFIHLPVRFLGLASLGVAVFCGVAVDQFARWFSKWWQLSIILIFSSLLVVLSGLPWLYPQYCDVPLEPTRLTLAQSTTWQRWFAEAQAETLPRWVTALPPESGLMAQYEAGEDINRLLLPDTGTLLDWRSQPADDTFVLMLDEMAHLTYQTFYFPGWRAEVDASPVSITPSAGQGLITVPVPAGEHTLSIKFGLTPMRLVALVISLLMGLGLLIWVWRAPKVNQLPDVDATFVGLKQVFPLFLATAAFLIAVKFILVDHLSTPIRADRLHDGMLLDVPNPTQINFGNEIIHLGYKGDIEVLAHEPVYLTQYWTALRGIGVPYGLRLQIVDDEGQTWHSAPGRPFSYAQFPSTESWQVGEYVRDAYVFNLLPGTPPGDYWLETAVFRRDTDLSLMPTGDEVGSAPDQARIGRLRVLTGEWSLDAETAQVSTFKPTPITAVPGLSLLGWTVPDVVFRSGDLAKVDLLWQADEDILDEKVTVDLQLVDANGMVANETAVLVGSPGAKDVVRDKVAWRLPPSLETGLYTVALTFGPQTLELGQWQIEAPSRIFKQPEVDIMLDVDMDFAQLVGYSFSGTMLSESVAAPDTEPIKVRPGELVELELVWQASAETPSSYRVFVHVLDENGNLVTQSDAIPDHWMRPTTGWMSGEFIQDHHALTLPPEITPGEYSLVVGLYEPVAGDRVGMAEIGTLMVDDE